MTDTLDASMTMRMEDIENYRSELQPRAGTIKVYRDYANGTHQSTLTAKQQKVFAAGKHLPVENLVGIILNTLAGRLRLEAWDVVDEQVQAYLADVWMRNQMPKTQFQTHYATARDGMHAIITSWNSDANRVMITREQWWNGEDGVFVAFDEYDQPAWAIKEWAEPSLSREEPEIKRRVVYYPDHIDRFRSVDGAWRPYVLPGDTDLLLPNTESIDWTDSDDQPIGLPVIPFAAGSLNDTPYGISEVDALLGLQDGLNALHSDTDATAATTAYQIYWASGVVTADDDEGLDVQPGVVWELEASDARAGAIAAGDMGQLLNTTDKKRQAMMIASETPVNQFTGQWPSGTALLRSEMQAIMKAERWIDQLQPAWQLTAHRTTEIFNVFGDGPELDEDAPITARFADPERLDELTKVEIQRAKVDLFTAVGGITDDTLLDKLDFLTDDDRTAIRAARAEKAVQDVGAFF